MSYSGPPGYGSLPPRPPASKTGGGFKPAFPTTTSAPPTYAAKAPYSGNTSYSASAAPVAAAQYGTTASTYSYPHSPALATQRGAFGASNQTYNYAASHAQQPAYYGAPVTGTYSTPPQIRNPFPQPHAAAPSVPVPAAVQNPFDRSDPNYDPEMAAQIAQWQSAYLPKEGAEPSTTVSSTKVAGAKPTSGSGPTFNAEIAAKAAQDDAVNTAGDKQKTVYREGGGKKWADDSLLEWDPSHLRIFVGNLAGETTDDSLLKAFARWQSVQKAKVVRDKRTNKSKGFGFVSFSDPDDFFQAAKEMNGKYIQSHPVVVRKSTTEIRPTNVKNDKRNKGKNHKKGGKNSGNGSGHADEGYSPYLGPRAGGIVKSGTKTKGGMKFLG